MIQQLKQIWTLLNSEHRGVIYFVCMVAAVTVLWVMTVVYGLGFNDGYDAAKTPHIPAPTFNEIIRR